MSAFKSASPIATGAATGRATIGSDAAGGVPSAARNCALIDANRASTCVCNGEPVIGANFPVAP